MAAVKEPLKSLEIGPTTEVYADNEVRESMQDRRQIHKKGSVGDILKLEQKWNLRKTEMVKHEGWAAGVTFLK